MVPTKSDVKVDVTRERLLFDSRIDWDSIPGTMKRFSRLNVTNARELISEGYIDPGSQQNFSPSMERMVCTIEEFNEIDGVTATVDGYIIAPERADTRIIFDALVIEGDLSVETVATFANEHHLADSFYASKYFCKAQWD